VISRAFLFAALAFHALIIKTGALNRDPEHITDRLQQEQIRRTIQLVGGGTE